MAKLKLSPPWITYYNEVEAMFRNDKNIHVVLDEDNCELKVYVDGPASQYEALAKLLPTEKEFGNIVLEIKVIPANAPEKKLIRVSQLANDEEMDLRDLFASAFRGSKTVVEIVPVAGVFGFNACYVVFAKEVVQFFDDNLGDLNGMRSTLYENIARDIFNPINGVMYCTSVEGRNSGFLSF